jgi:hypothetical protein
MCGMTSAKVRRENVPVTEAEQSILALLLQDTRERRALMELAGDFGSSRASAAHAVLSVGMDVVRARVQELAYIELAESYTEHEMQERREEARISYARSAEVWGSE